MARKRIIEARVRQKTDTLEVWMNNDLPLLDGEQAFIRSDVDGEVIGFKLASEGKKFSELPYPDFTTRGKVSPTSSFVGRQSGVYIPTTNGTYNGVPVNLTEGYQVLYWDGSTLEKVVYPAEYNTAVFGGVIDSTKDLSIPPPIPTWYIASAGTYNTVPPITLTENSILTWNGTEWSHIPFELEIRGEFLVADNIVDEVRNITPQVAQLLVNGTYKAVQVLGYYQPGDTPAPINYYVSDTTESDDGGSVFEVGGIKLEHIFDDYFSVRYFGAKCDYNQTTRVGTDDLVPWINAIAYQNRNRNKEILFDSYTLISDTVVLSAFTKTSGTGVLNSGFYSNFEGKNVFEYKNGYVVEDDVVTSWGTQCQVKLTNFHIGCTIQKPVDEFGRQLEFLNSTALHLEGLRYRGLIEHIRILAPFDTGFYFFGSWGSRISSCDALRGSKGFVFDSGTNGVTLEKCLTQRVGDMNDVVNSGSVILTGYGDAENQRGNGYNMTIKDSIFERGLGAPAIKADNITNLSIENIYIERQTTNSRSVILSRCNTVCINNVNIENSLGISLTDCEGVSINGYSLYTTNRTYPVENVIALYGLNRDVVIENAFYEGKKLQLTTTQEVTNLILNKNQAENLRFRPYFDIYNRFIDPVFAKKSPFATSGTVTSSYESNGLRLVFPISSNYDFIGYSVGGYVSQGTGNVNLIVHLTATGRGRKIVTMTRSSGGVVQKDFDFEGEGVLIIRSPTSSGGGILHNFRIGVPADNEEEVVITVHGVYLGEHNYSSLLMELPVNATPTVKGLVNQAAAVPNGSSVDDVLQALRDASLMAT